MSAVSNPLPIRTPEPISPAVPPSKSGSGIPWKWIIGLLVAAGLAWAVYQSLAKKEAQTAAVPAIRIAKVTTGDLDSTVRVAGQTSARSFVTVTAPIQRGPEGGRDMILMQLVPNGSHVKKGQLVAQIDAQSMQDHVDDLGDTIEAAEADVRKRKAEIAIEWESLQQTLRLAQSEYDKAKLDAGAGEVRTDIERQLLQLNLEEAAANLKQRQNDIAAKKISQDASLKMLELTRERHTRHRNRHISDVKRFTIYASMDGLAVMSPIFRGGEMAQIQQGDRVFPGQGFMKIVDPRTMQLEASINQTESSDFRIGQKAEIHLDAFPEVKLQGKVYSIGALAVGGWRQNYYIRTVPIRVQIDGTDPRLIPDLSASANVLFTHTEKQTIVPRAALAQQDGKIFAFVKKGDAFEKREVKTGGMNETHAAVVTGLHDGEEVRLN